MNRLLGARYEKMAHLLLTKPFTETIMTKFFNRFAKDESGATAIEYGLIAALIAVAMITVLGTVSTNLNGTFTKVANSLK